MARITLRDLSVEEVELPGGHVYTVTPATRKVIADATKLDEKLDEHVDDLDALVGIYGELLSVRLKPTKTGQPRAATVIKKLWESNDVTLPLLEQLMADVNETDRPT